MPEMDESVNPRHSYTETPMAIITISDHSSGSSASIVPRFGFNCFRFLADVDGQWVDVIDSSEDFPRTGENPSRNGSPILFPFPNRIALGKYSWRGKDYTLPASGSMPHAIHGFAYDRPWRVIDRGDDFVTGEFRISQDDPDRAACWPSDGIIQLRYRVHRSTLRIDVTITNPDDVDLPWGFGTHTYFKLPLGKESQAGRCLIQAPAHKQWVLEECIPTGVIRDIPPTVDLRSGAYLETRQLDDVLTDLRPEGDSLDCLIMDEQAGLEVIQQCDPSFRELVAFTPSWTQAVCLEPYTCTTNAIQLEQQGIDAGWQVLPPGESWTTWIQITARPILA